MSLGCPICRRRFGWRWPISPGAAREWLLAMSVAAGMAVMQALFEAEIAEVAGAKGKDDPNRAAVRHGSGRGSVDLPRNRGGMHYEE